MSLRARAAVVGLVVMSLVPASAPPGLTWANGTGGCNSFGAHDWILKKAIKAAGNDASWVRMRVGLRATDDPDWWGNEWGAADEATAVWFRRTKRRLEASRERAASRALGIMSHFIADVANPMHTDQSNKEEDIHSPYEDDVDERIQHYPFRYDGGDDARPGPLTRRVARIAHRSYWDLVNAYDGHDYNRKVHRITRRQLRRAVNALADLVISL
jgi:hypothetical protein